MRSLWAMAAVLSALSGCASDPDKISAAFVSPITYDNYTCDQIASDLSTIEPRLGEAIDAQRNQRHNDMVSGALIGITPTMLNGDEGREATIADLKGKQQALRSEGAQKGCPLPPADLGKYEAARTYLDPKTGKPVTYKDGREVTAE